MAASFPGAIKNFSTIVNGVTKLVASLFNSPYEEITAIETALGTNLSNTKLGSWTSGSPGYAAGTAYLAATDGFVSASAILTNGIVTGYTDAANPPTTIVAASSGDPSGNKTLGICFPVKTGHYWKVTSATTILWIPMGT